MAGGEQEGGMAMMTAKHKLKERKEKPSAERKPDWKRGEEKASWVAKPQRS